MGSDGKVSDDLVGFTLVNRVYIQSGTCRNGSDGNAPELLVRGQGRVHVTGRTRTHHDVRRILLVTGARDPDVMRSRRDGIERHRGDTHVGPVIERRRTPDGFDVT